MSTRFFSRQKNLFSSPVFLLFFLFIIPFSSVFAFTWQGPYAGAYLGSSFSTNHMATDAGIVTDTSYFENTSDIDAVNHAGTSSSHHNTIMAGIEVGHDWTWKKIVYGVSFDYNIFPLSFSNQENNLTYPNSAETYSLQTSASTNWLFTLRGRLGYQADLHCPSLLYVTAGPALTQIKVNHHFSDRSPYEGMGSNKFSENKIGWATGAGIEIAAFDHATVSLEYLYIRMPSAKVTDTISKTADTFGISTKVSPFSTTAQLHASLIKLELRYRFDDSK